jgi:hypothetical protein
MSLLSRWGETVSLNAFTNGSIIQVIYEYGEPRWNDIDREIPRNSKRNLLHSRIYREPYMELPGREPEPPRWETGG